MKHVFLFKKDDNGFTITELLVAMGLLGVILIGIYGLLAGGQTSDVLGEKRVIAQGNARQAMLKICSELRQCYSIENTTTPTSLLTDNWTLSFRSLQFNKERLNAVAGSNNTRYAASRKPWHSGAKPLVLINDGIVNVGYTEDFTNGEIVFSASLLEADAVEASYSWDVYVQYLLNDGRQIIKRLYNTNGTQISSEMVVTNVVNKNVSPQVPFISRSGNYVTIRILIDDDLTRPPATFRLESSIKARV